MKKDVILTLDFGVLVMYEKPVLARIFHEG